MKKDALFNKSPYDEFGPKSTYLGFFLPKEPNGDMFHAVMVIDGIEHSIDMRHDQLDGLLYAIQSLKQDMELMRLRNENSS